MDKALVRPLLWANSAQRRVVGTSRQIEMNENITLVISDPFLNNCGNRISYRLTPT